MKRIVPLLVLPALFIGMALIPVPPPTNYYSITDGVFEAITTWSTTSHEGATCLCSSGCDVGNNENVFIAHDLTSVCDPIHIEGGGDLSLVTGGSLTLAGDANITGNGDLSVDSGATLTVPGDVNISGNGDVIVNGDMIVGGNIDVTGSGNLCGTGTITLTGSFTNGGSCFELTVVTGVGSLPIELVSFTAKQEEGRVVLDWATAAEDDNEFFTVERSSNGLSFTPILEVPGAMNSTEYLTYQAFDDEPLSGVSYYRLRQTDTDGASEVSPIVAMDFDASLGMDGECVFQVNPNPCQGNCRVVLSDCPQNAAQSIVVDMIDASGNKVSSVVPVRNFDGSFDFSIDRANNLKPGVYFVVGNSETEKYASQVIMR